MVCSVQKFSILFNQSKLKKYYTYSHQGNIKTTEDKTRTKYTNIIIHLCVIQHIICKILEVTSKYFFEKCVFV